MCWAAKRYSFVLTLALFLAGLVVLMWMDKSPIFIESLESRTVAGNPVFNKIYYESTSDADIWLMEQSHSGAKALQHEWDKIAIVVKKKNSVRKAEFYQLASGTELISMNLRPIGLKASCFLCHSNGPRAIRPNFDSENVKISYWDQARIQLWNFRIKSYGPMESFAPAASKKKFRFEQPMANKELQVQSCTKCHNSEKLFGRGTLTKQNFMTIKFMVEKKFMPPLGFSLSDKDRDAVYDFTDQSH